MKASKDYETTPVYKRNRWGLIITDEAHTYRNWQSKTSVAMLRLVLGWKPSEENAKYIGDMSLLNFGGAFKKKFGDKDNSDGDKVSKKSYFKYLIPHDNEGSPNSFRFSFFSIFTVNIFPNRG